MLNFSANLLDCYVDGAKSVLGGVLRMQIRSYNDLINTYDATDVEKWRMSQVKCSFFLKIYRMSQAVGAGRGSLGSNLPSLCIESALAHGGPDYALPVQ